MLNNNQTGLVQNGSDTVSVIGGENPTLQQSVILGQSGIAYGSATTQGLTTWPTATVAAFESYVGLVPVTGTGVIKPSATQSGAQGTHANALLLIGSLLLPFAFVLF